jgi:DNA-directed RNA polymerase subunit RPC12/RpoP
MTYWKGVRKMQPTKKYECAVCGKEISKQEYEDYEGMCWECWDDRLTEESDSMFDELL